MQKYLKYAVVFKKCGSDEAGHGLVNYIDSKAKFRHLKNWPVKGLRQVLIDWRYSQSYWYFRPSFVNCCPFNILSGSTLPPIPFLEKVYCTVNTYTICKGGGVYRVLGISQVNTCRKAPLHVNFLRWQHFALPSMSLIFPRSKWRDGLYASGTVFPLLICRICRREEASFLHIYSGSL